MSRLRRPRSAQSSASLEPLEPRALFSGTVFSLLTAGPQQTAVPATPVTVMGNLDLPSEAFPVDLSFALSPDNVAGNSDDIPFGTDTVHPTVFQYPDGSPGIGPAYWHEFTLPTNLAPGTYHLVTTVHTNTDSDEAANTSASDVITILPADTRDLTHALFALPADGYVGGSYAASPGSDIPVGVRPPNSVFGQPTRTNVAFVLSSDDVVGNADDILVGSYDVDAAFPDPPGTIQVPQGITLSVLAYHPSQHITLPASLAPGHYKLFSVVDPNSQIAESNESNNVFGGADVTITPSAPAAAPFDLTVGAPLVHDPSVPDSVVPPLVPLTPTPGSHIRVGAIPSSNFGQPIRPKVAFVLSSDDTYGNADDILLGSYDTTASTPPPPGMVVCFPLTTTVDIALPSTLSPGHYKLFAVVDPDNQIPEQDESNNVSPATDLTVFASTSTNNQQPPTSNPMDKLIQLQPTPTFRNITAGSSAKTSVTLTNPTGKSLTATYKVTFYLSTDPTLSRTDKAIATQALSITLRPHQTKSPQLTYRIPASAAAGHRYLITTLTPLRSTRITIQSAPPPTPLNIRPQSTSLKSRPISRQILTPDQP